MKKSSTIKTRNGGEWSDAKFFSFVKSGLRTTSVRWPPRYKTLAAAYVGQKINVESGRMAKHYKCAKCEGEFTQKNIEINHKIPVILTSGFDSWSGVIERMFCEAEGLEALCKPCHKVITKYENTLRKEKND